MSEREPKAPSRWWYLPAVAIPFGVAWVMLFPATQQLFDSVALAPRFAAPGGAELELASGTHTLFAEESGAIAAENPDCEVSAPSGVKLPLVEETGTEYRNRGRSGRSMYEFTATEPGIHRIACNSAGGAGRVAVVRSDVRNLVSSVVITLTTLAVCIAWEILIFLKRRRRGAPFP